MPGTENGLLVQLVVTLGGSGVVVAVIQSVTSRRRTRAEAVRTYAEGDGAIATAAKTTVDTTVALLVPMREEMVRLAARVAQQDKEMDKQNAEIALLRAEVRAGHGRDSLLQAYTAWARRATEKLSAAGIPIDPPPTDE